MTRRLVILIGVLVVGMAAPAWGTSDTERIRRLDYCLGFFDGIVRNYFDLGLPDGPILSGALPTEDADDAASSAEQGDRMAEMWRADSEWLDVRGLIDTVKALRTKTGGLVEGGASFLYEDWWEGVDDGRLSNFLAGHELVYDADRRGHRDENDPRYNVGRDNLATYLACRRLVEELR